MSEINSARVAHTYETSRTRIRTFINNGGLIVINSNELSELIIDQITFTDYMYAGPTGSDSSSDYTGSGQEYGFDQNIEIQLDLGNKWFKQYTNKTFKSIDDADYFTLLKIDITDPGNHYNNEFIDTDLIVWLPGDSENFDSIESAVKDNSFVKSRTLAFHYVNINNQKSYVCYPGTIDSDDDNVLDCDSNQLAVFKQIKQLLLENSISTTMYVSSYSGTSNTPITLVGQSYFK